jgi:WXXGXW repeat (2 copies)
MNKSTLSLIAALCLAAPAALHAGVEVGIRIGGPEIIVSTQPPPPRVEVVPMSPGPGFIWVRGHWSWHHEHWVWIDGHWDRVAQPGAVWVPGQWVARGNGWVWVEGHYSSPLPPPPPGAVTEVIASEEPPAPIVEAIPVAPGPDYFWIGGHWHWNGGWVWIGGHYDRHPHFHPGGYWEAGHWAHHGNGWVWHEGHWR